jgi:hypothetical protein
MVSYDGIAPTAATPIDPTAAVAYDPAMATEFRQLVIPYRSDAWRILDELGRLTSHVEAGTLAHDAALVLGDRKLAAQTLAAMQRDADAFVLHALTVGAYWNSSKQTAAAEARRADLAKVAA